MDRVSPGKLFDYHGAFNRLEPKVKSFPIIGCDTEDNSAGLPLSFAFHTGHDSFYTTDVSEALDYIYNTPDTSIFVAHNLEYDIGNLFKACDWKYIDQMVYASKLIKVTLKGTKNFFINSSSFFAGSLSAMAKFVGLKKLDGDVYNPDYNIMDARIVQVFMHNFQEKLNNHFGINLGVTIGQMAMQSYRRNYMPSKKQITFNSENCLKAYYGGRVEVFYKGILKEKIIVSDINSSYPDVMKNNSYPDTSYIEPSSIKTHEYGIGHFKILVPPDTFLPVLPYKSESGRLFFPVGIVDGWWTYAEVRYAVAHGAKILGEFYGEGTNVGCDPFRDFIDALYTERQKYKQLLKREPDNADAKFFDLLFKLKMNNLYGKWCQHKPESAMFRDRLPLSELKRMLKIKKGTFFNRETAEKMGVKEFLIGPFFSYEIPRTHPPKTANYLWGVYVTSYARISLHRKMVAVHQAGGRLIYCDTDSIMFTAPPPARKLPYSPEEIYLPSHFSRSNGTSKAALFHAARLHAVLSRPLKKQEHPAVTALTYGSALGQMSKEVYGLGVFRQAKGYLLCNWTKRGTGDNREFIIKKVACKGVPTHYALDFITRGLAEGFRKPMRLKEALIRTFADENKDAGEEFFKEVGINIWRSVEKRMKSIYIKRKGDIGITYPVNVQEIPDLEQQASEDGASIEEDLADVGATIVNHPDMIKRRKDEEKFAPKEIPEGWFHRTQEWKEEERFFESQKIHLFRKEECIGLQPDDIWFSGRILESKKGKYGRHFILALKKYRGEKVAEKNMLGAVSTKWFEDFDPDEEFIGKIVEFSMRECYLGKGALNVGIMLRG